MKFSEINPHIRYAENRTLPPVSCFTRAYDCRLLYLRRGRLRFFCGGEVFELSEGALLFWNSGICYRFEAEEEPELILLNFDLTQSHSDIIDPLPVAREEDFRPELRLECADIEDCPDFSAWLILRNMRHIENDLMTIVSEMHEQKRFFRETASALLKRILCDMARGSLIDDAAAKTVERVIGFICEHYPEPITNHDISESVNYHEFYVNRLMQKQTGMTLHRYLVNYRVQSAARLLVTTDEPVSKISELCGFSSDVYFISAFKSRFGTTPSEYRRSKGGLI